MAITYEFIHLLWQHICELQLKANRKVVILAFCESVFFSSVIDKSCIYVLHFKRCPCKPHHAPCVWLENGAVICSKSLLVLCSNLRLLCPSNFSSSFYLAGSFCLMFNHQPVCHCQELEGVEVFGVVEGGDVLEERVRSARETAKRPVAGFCLDSLRAGSIDPALRTQLITAVTKELPEDKPRSALLVTAWEICVLIKAILFPPIIHSSLVCNWKVFSEDGQSSRTKQEKNRGWVNKQIVPSVLNSYSLSWHQ